MLPYAALSLVTDAPAGMRVSNLNALTFFGGLVGIVTLVVIGVRHNLSVGIFVVFNPVRMRNAFLHSFFINRIREVLKYSSDICYMGSSLILHVLCTVSVSAPEFFFRPVSKY